MTLTTVNENAPDDDETAILTVSAGVGCSIGSPYSATGTILNAYYTPTADFIKQDTTTKGTWINTYGVQGYDVINAAASLPSYATVTPAGQTAFTTVASTSDPRALQVPGGSNRVVAGWYASWSFTVAVTLADGQPHGLELYFLDWSNSGRVERVQIANAATGAVLSTQTISSFASGVYLDYAAGGSIVITITDLAGPNAVLNGLFVDPVPTSASFIAQDTTTQGTWINTYGAQGYDVINAASSLPSYAAVTPTGETPFTTVASTTDPRALQVPGGSRTVAGWYSFTSFTVLVDIADGQTHGLELYFLDWSKSGRVEQVQITNAETGAVLDSRTVSSFNGGIYLNYAVSGDVLITITDQAGPNAVLNGLFLDPVPTAESFIKQDATTQGTWIGAYGAQGYDVINAAASLPGYATVTPAGQTAFTTVSSTTDPLALQVPGGSNRVVAGWYANSSFTVAVNLTDGQNHDLELYFLDWSKSGRVERVQITNAATGAVLDSRTVASFAGGVYLDYTVRGNIVITITNQAGPNAVLNGLFLDPVPTSAPSSAAMTRAAGVGPGIPIGGRPSLSALAIEALVSDGDDTGSQAAPAAGGAYPGRRGVVRIQRRQ